MTQVCLSRNSRKSKISSMKRKHLELLHVIFNFPKREREFQKVNFTKTSDVKLYLYIVSVCALSNFEVSFGSGRGSMGLDFCQVALVNSSIVHDSLDPAFFNFSLATTRTTTNSISSDLFFLSQLVLQISTVQQFRVYHLPVKCCILVAICLRLDAVSVFFGQFIKTCRDDYSYIFYFDDDYITTTS